MLFVSQRLTYGIQLPLYRYQALIAGDLSGNVIHSFFVHYANLVGSQFYQERLGKYSDSILFIQAAHLRSTLDAFSIMKEAEDPLSFAQACWCLSVAYGTVQSRKFAVQNLKKAMDVIHRNSIRFASINFPSTEGTPETSTFQLPLTENEYEKVAFLGQIVYVGAVFYVAGQPDAASLLDQHLHSYQLSVSLFNMHLTNFADISTVELLRGPWDAG